MQRKSLLQSWAEKHRDRVGRGEMVAQLLQKEQFPRHPGRATAEVAASRAIKELSP